VVIAVKVMILIRMVIRVVLGRKMVVIKTTARRKAGGMGKVGKVRITVITVEVTRRAKTTVMSRVVAVCPRMIWTESLSESL